MKGADMKVDFADPHLVDVLATLPEAQLEDLEFGVIGFDAQGTVRRYNTFESRGAGLSPDRVIGHDLFTSVAPCMNNFMVAQKFEAAAAAHEELDTTLDYVLTLRMKPVKVALRLLAGPKLALRYVLVKWQLASPPASQ
jgi:photoactive yellow protein